MSAITSMEIAEIAGLLILSALGFYALQLLASFRTGILAKSWRYISVGALFLILAQIPLISEGTGLFQAYVSSLAILVMAMRFIGIVFLIIGLRVQSKVWQTETGSSSHGSIGTSIEV
jgi:arginine exporter protein ArgO